MTEPPQNDERSDLGLVRAQLEAAAAMNEQLELEADRLRHELSGNKDQMLHWQQTYLEISQRTVAIEEKLDHNQVILRRTLVALAIALFLLLVAIF